MSTLAYGALTETRRQAQPGTSSTTTPGLGTYIDIFAALVPAEVLAAHAFILTLATSTEKDNAGHDVVVITERGALRATFWVLLVMSAVLFMVGRWLKQGGQPFDWRWDFVRILVPPTAFFGWTLIQKNTAFDAISSWHGNERAIIAVLGALVLSLVAGLLSVKADRE
jgi:hypothetical protein